MNLVLLASLLFSVALTDSPQYSVNQRVQQLANRHISRYHPQRHKSSIPAIRYSRNFR